MFCQKRRNVTRHSFNVAMANVLAPQITVMESITAEMAPMSWNVVGGMAVVVWPGSMAVVT